jgi:alpha-mannosidase
VRYLEELGEASLSTIQKPFMIQGAPNVFLETIKRGECDSFGYGGGMNNKSTTIVLRFYEALGGHARVYFRIAGHFSVTKAFVTNLLEDEGTELYLMRKDDLDGYPTSLKLDFRGFEVKTVKLVISKNSI